RPLAAPGRTGAGPAPGRARLARGAASLAGRRSTAPSHAAAGLHGLGALRSEAGRCRGGLQSQEARPAESSSALGLRRRERRLPGGALASRVGTYGRGGGRVDPRPGSPTPGRRSGKDRARSEEHTSEISHVKISDAVLCLKKKIQQEYE